MPTAEQNIYNRLAGAPTFHPVTADLFVDDWGLDAGDIVGVKQGDTTYSVPIYNLSLDWHGMPTAQIQSTGNKERKPLPALKRKQYAGGKSSYRRSKEQETVIETRFVQDETRIGFVVEETQGGYVINAAHVVAGINSQDKTSTSYVDISADYINLTGYVTATQLDAVQANIDKLTSGVTTASILRATAFYSGQATIEQLAISGRDPVLSLFGNQATWKTVTIAGTASSTSVLGTGGTGVAIPDAIATIEVDNNPPSGKIGFKYTTFSSSTPVAVNFSIADTAKYQADVGMSSLTLNGPSDSAYSSGTDQGTLTANKYYQVKATPNVGNSSYIKFKTPSGGSTYNYTPDDIRIGNISYYSSLPSGGTTLDTLATSIHANKGKSGYVRIVADLDGYTGTPKYYYIPMSGI